LKVQVPIRLPCDGSKSVTCIKFISDAPPLDANIAACNETCPGASDGAIIIYDVAGGSDDPNSDSDYADGLAGAGTYEIDVVSGPVTGTIFAYAGGSSWQATGLPPGVYTIDIRDALASGDTFDDDADDTVADCGAACTIQRVVEILAGPELPVVPTVVQPTCTENGMASIVIDKISTMALPAQTFCEPTIGQVSNITAPFSVAGFNNGCTDEIGPTTVVEVCFTNVVQQSGQPGDAIQIFLVSPSGSNITLGLGGAFGGGAGSLSGDFCLNGTTDDPFSLLSGPVNGTWQVDVVEGYVGADLTVDEICITVNDKWRWSRSNYFCRPDFNLGKCEWN